MTQYHLSITRWRLIWQMVRRELSRYLSFNLFFAINLSLGLVGLVMINALQDSINGYLEINLRHNLGGDLAVVSRQPMTYSEQTIINRQQASFMASTQKIDFFSMLNSKQGARLVNVIAIDKDFPLYGDLSLINGKAIVSEFTNTGTKTSLPPIWMLSNTRQSLGVSEGDVVSIADKRYRVSKDISQNSSAIGLAFSVAPIIYVQRQHLDYAYLGARGSRVSYVQILRLKPGENTIDIAQQLRQDLDKQFAEKTVPRIRTYLSASRQLSNLLTQAASYLSMFALIALFLAGLGATYLYRGNLIQRLESMAILHALGMTKQEITTIYVLQSFLLGAIATAIALLLSTLLLPVFNQFLGVLNVVNFTLGLTLKSVLLACLTGMVGSLAFCYPAIRQIDKINANHLLKAGSEVENQTGEKHPLSKYSPYISVLGFIFVISIYQTSLSSGVFFLFVFICVLMAMGLMATLLLKLCEKFSCSKHVIIKMAFRNIVRHRWGSIVTFSVLGLGAFLLTVVPQIYQGLQSEIDASDKYQVPSLFLFDIQPEQVSPLRDLIAKQGQDLLSVTPMVRGRLQKVDGKAPNPRRFEQAERSTSRDEEQNQGNNNLFRHVNITYRSHVLSSESIYRGVPLEAKYEGIGEADDPIAVSIEERYAKRVGIELGSLLEFDIQGITVFAKVVNLRKVKWNSFNPNFFIVMQPGLLEEAPQTYLATIAKADIDGRIALQTNIIRTFSNISSVDVTDLIKQLIDITEKIVLAMTVIAVFAILVGFMVIYSISHAEAKQKSGEMNLLKVLGGRQKSIYHIFMLEFGTISSSASFLGIGLSVLAAWIFSHYLFENLWHLDIFLMFIAFVCLNIFTLSLTLISARHTLRQKVRLQN